MKRKGLKGKKKEKERKRKKKEERRKKKGITKLRHTHHLTPLNNVCPLHYKLYYIHHNQYEHDLNYVVQNSSEPCHRRTIGFAPSRQNWLHFHCHQFLHIQKLSFFVI